MKIAADRFASVHFDQHNSMEQLGAGVTGLRNAPVSILWKHKS